MRHFCSAIAALVPLTAFGAAKPTETVIYNFLGKPDGANPLAAVIADAAGNLYTTTSRGGTSPGGSGTVVRLSPPRAGQTAWSETKRYSFHGASDGSQPQAALLFDAAGNLYTTAQRFGVLAHSGKGALVELMPPPKHKAWPESVLLNFTATASTDGALPVAGLVADAAGNLYTTMLSYGPCCGTAVSFSPPAAGQTGWKETLLYAFKGGTDGAYPDAELLADAAGNFYTTTSSGGDTACGNGSSCGTVVKLSPPAAGQTAWTETVLYRFTGGMDGQAPVAGLAADGAGNLYTTTSAGGGTGCGGGGCGTVVEVSPPASGQTAWTETVLYRFAGGADGAFPLARALLDGAGSLYTTTYGNTGASQCGNIVKLSPPGVGGGAWSLSVLHQFHCTAGDGGNPAAGLLADSAGNLFTTTSNGGSAARGAVVELKHSGFVVPGR